MNNFPEKLDLNKQNYKQQSKSLEVGDIDKKMNDIPKEQTEVLKTKVVYGVHGAPKVL